METYHEMSKKGMRGGGIPLINNLFPIVHPKRLKVGRWALFRFLF